MSKAVARELLLEQLPLRALRRVARSLGLSRTSSAMTRAKLREELGSAREVTIEAVLSLLTEEELERAARGAGIGEGLGNRREMKARLLGAAAGGGRCRLEAGAPEPAEAFTADTRYAAHLFQEYEGDGSSRLYVGREIPIERLGMASERFPLPNYEYIMVFYDNSLRGNGATGLAVGGHGIYWRNPLGLGAGRCSLAWHEFVRGRIRREGEHEIHVGGDASIHVTFLDTRGLARVLKAVQLAVRESGMAGGMPLVTPNAGLVAQSCRRYNGLSLQSFHIGPRLSKRLVSRARASFLIPDFEKLSVVCDNTVFGSCERGFAIGEHGIYWRNEPGTYSSRHALSWPELALAHVGSERDEIITLGDNVRIHVEFLPGGQGVELFRELQRLVRDAVDATADRKAIRNGGKQRRGGHLNEQYTPVFVARARDEVLRNQILEQLGALLWESADRSFALTASAVSGVLRGLRLRR